MPDATLVRMALRQSIEPVFTVTHVLRLDAAIAHIAAGTPTDVILLDLSLPDAFGEETVARMRAATARVPIVVMTGLDDPTFAEHILELGAQDYLVKEEGPHGSVVRSIRYAITRMTAQLEREELVAKLSAAVAFKNRMIGILAHDLRNPLGIISGYAEFLEMVLAGRVEPREIESLGHIRSSSAFMLALIEDVLAMAVAETADTPLNRAAIDATRLVAAAVEHGRLLAKAKGVAVVVAPPIDGPRPLHGDAMKIERVLDNLIGNAVKFSRRGDTVRVSVQATDDWLEIAVADQGAGIPGAIREHLFQPFCQGAAGTDGEPSTGLGLYICSRIVTAHGGRIAVDSAEGQGTVFTVALPRA
ncbi:MAG: response regulator [Magnetospirillum sp.]|nr:response regulator [Magnetospirillum sp.]